MNRELWEKSVGFHGHECPGLAIGVRACEAAAERLGVSYSKDEEVVCITENNACGVDAVQFITGCTFGKGNLIFKDKGKQAFTFFRRDIGQGIRVVFKGVNKLGDRKKWQEYILNAPLNELFDFKTPNYECNARYAVNMQLKAVSGLKMGKRYAWTVFVNQIINGRTNSIFMSTKCYI
jgi:formylmethanofuran dehydrogenase subunit E